MARVQRGNVVLTVPEDEVQRYLQLGYDLTTPGGKILQAAIPNDFATLQKAYVDNQARIAELENTVAKLTSELAEAKRTSVPTTGTTSAAKKSAKK